MNDHAPKPPATPSPILARLEAMLASGQDSTALRFGLGNGYLRAGEPQRAIEHLRAAVALDPAYSAGWKTLGQACVAAGDPEGAKCAWETGIAAAEGRGDIQAAREMRVFRRRLDKGS